MALLPFPTRDSNQSDPRRRVLPASWADWQAVYERRDCAYQAGPYSGEDRLAWQLFQARDDADEVIAETRRLTRDVQHVVDTDAHLLVGQSIRLDADAPALEDAARLVWTRSQADINLGGLWARTFAGLGRTGLVVRRTRARPPFRTTLVHVDPRHYRAFYDADTGTRLERVIITFSYFDEPTLTRTGELIEDSALHTFTQELTREGIQTWVDGVEVAEQTGAHGLGEVPFVNARFIPVGDSEHGLWSAHGLDSVIAVYDSLVAQISAIGTRYANPKLVVKGADIGSSSELSFFGRVLNFIGANVDQVEISYLEPNLAQLGPLLDAAREARLTAKESIPEFLYANVGAGASGEALKFWSSALVAKIMEARGRFYSALERATAYAVAMDGNRAFDPDADALTVQGGPVLPVDTAAELASLEAAERLGLQKRDVIRKLQDLGFVPQEIDAEDYSAETQDQRADGALAFFRQGAAADPGEPPDPSDDPGPGDGDDQ